MRTAAHQTPTPPTTYLDLLLPFVERLSMEIVRHSHEQEALRGMSHIFLSYASEDRDRRDPEWDIPFW